MQDSHSSDTSTTEIIKKQCGGKAVPKVKKTWWKPRPSDRARRQSMHQCFTLAGPQEQLQNQGTTVC